LGAPPLREEKRGEGELKREKKREEERRGEERLQEDVSWKEGRRDLQGRSM
jgi:hypothetical protein